MCLSSVIYIQKQMIETFVGKDEKTNVFCLTFPKNVRIIVSKYDLFF